MSEASLTDSHAEPVDRNAYASPSPTTPSPIIVKREKFFTASGLAFSVRPLHPADSDDITELARWNYNSMDFIVEDFKRWMAMADGEVLHLGIQFDGATIDTTTTGAETANAGIDSSRAPFVGRLVAIEVSLILDGGATGWIYALRVHPAFRGLSLSSTLHSHCIDVTRHYPGVQRLREATSAENHISLGLAGKHGFRRLFESTWNITFESQWHARMAWIEAKIKERGLSLAQASLSSQHSDGLLSHGTIDDILTIRARHANHSDFQYLTQNWLSYEFTRENLVLLTAPPRAHDIVVGRDALTGELDSFTMARSGRDFSSATMYFTVYAASIDQCLLQLHYAMSRQATNVRPATAIDGSANDRYCRPMAFLPLFYGAAYPDWTSDLRYVLLEKPAE